MWCCIIRGSGSFRNTASLSLVNRLHSVKRCWAVCSAFSGQLHSGVGALFLLWRYERKQPWFVRNCCRELKPVTFWWSTVTLRWYWISWKSVKWSKLWNSTHARARKHTHTHTGARDVVISKGLVCALTDVSRLKNSRCLAIYCYCTCADTARGTTG